MTTPSHDGYEVTVTGAANFRWSGLTRIETGSIRTGRVSRTDSGTPSPAPPQTPA